MLVPTAVLMRCDWWFSSSASGCDSHRPGFHLIVSDGVVYGIGLLLPC